MFKGASGLLCFLISVSLYSQPQNANIWYFGGFAGLDFNSGSPVAITDGNVLSYEGCGVISDDNGNLLFYTDVNTVWDRTHTAMPNGTGLLGHESAAQTGLCVPHPGNSNQYYIFTTGDVEMNAPSRLHYSIVDMSLNSGNGNIVTGQKNVVLLNNVVERVTGVLHDNCEHYWVITHNNNTSDFYAYLIDNSGLNTTTPTISTIGAAFSAFGDAGFLKVSHDGSMLVNTMEYSRYVELYDFDNSTGAVSNLYTIPMVIDAYGAEFSLDLTRLYISTTDNQDVYQFDLTSSDIAGSRVTIGNASNGFMPPYRGGALQMGPDGKIYMATLNTYSLDVIANPNGLGSACNFQNAGQTLGTRISKEGLPTFLQSYLYQTDFTFEDTCANSGTTFTLANTNNVTATSWYFGDSQTSTNINPTNNYTSDGAYTVELIYTQCAVTDTIEKDIDIVDCGLPIELISFRGWNEGDVNQLEWITGTEINNDYFTIERSTDQRNFKAIGTIEGAGNSQYMIQYGFVDENPVAGTTYYRIKQTDFDGKKSYSAVISISMETSLEITNLFPSIAENEININISSLESKEILIEIIDISGKQVKNINLQLSKGENLFGINVSELSAGKYFVKQNELMIGFVKN